MLPMNSTKVLNRQRDAAHAAFGQALVSFLSMINISMHLTQTPNKSGGGGGSGPTHSPVTLKPSAEGADKCVFGAKMVIFFSRNPKKSDDFSGWPSSRWFQKYHFTCSNCPSHPPLPRAEVETRHADISHDGGVWQISVPRRCPPSDVHSLPMLPPVNLPCLYDLRPPLPELQYLSVPRAVCLRVSVSLYCHVRLCAEGG